MKLNVLALLFISTAALKSQIDQVALVETGAEGILDKINSATTVATDNVKETRSGSMNTAMNVAGKLGMSDSCIMKKLNIYHTEKGEDDYPYVPNCGLGSASGKLF